MNWLSAVANLVARAEHGDRGIVLWSEHDLNIVRTLGTMTRISSRA